MTIKEANDQKLKKITHEDWRGQYLEFEYDDQGLVTSTKLISRDVKNKRKRFLPVVKNVVIPDQWFLEDDWYEYH